MNARKIKAASSAAAPSNGKAAGADANSTRSRSAEDKTKAKVKAEDTTKSKSAGVPAGGVAKFRPKADGDDAEDADTALRWVLKDMAAGGVTWDSSNTAPTVKTFTVQLRLDLGDRIRLGMLAAGCRCAPERFLSNILRVKFEECADKLLKDKSAQDFCAGAFLHSVSALVDVNGAPRLAFVPAVMA